MVDADLFIRLCGIAWRWGVAIIDNNGDVLLSSRCSHYCPGAGALLNQTYFLIEEIFLAAIVDRKYCFKNIEYRIFQYQLNQ